MCIDRIWFVVVGELIAYECMIFASVTHIVSAGTMESPDVCVVFLICGDGAYVDVLLMMSSDRINRQIDTAIAYVKCCVVMVCMITMSAGWVWVYIWAM